MNGAYRSSSLASMFFKAAKLLFLPVFVILFFSFHADLTWAADTGNGRWKEQEVLVKFRQGANDHARKSAHGRHGSKLMKRFRLLGIDRVKIRPGMSVEEAVSIYKNDPDVEYAEPNYRIYAHRLSDDPLLPNLWGLYNYGQTGGVSGADIMAPEAWDITTGDPGVVVAVLDTGLDYTHEDIVPNVWVNTDEIAGNGIDDDGNGYIDDIYGINAMNGTGNVMDDFGHGSHVSGTIGGAGDNAIGVAGVNWDIRIMTCKFLGANGSGYISDAVECLEYVKAMKDRGANVIATNNSWGGGGYSQALYDAIALQMDSDILFIASAANDGLDNDMIFTLPASYDLPNIISVAATDHADNKASWSNFGATTVDVGAPGVGIVSLRGAGTIMCKESTLVPQGDPDTKYCSVSGTSMASPHVTGLAGLLKAQDPTVDWRRIRNLILSGGDDVLSMEGRTVTGKRINAYGSLTCSDRPVFKVLQYPADYQVGTVVSLSVFSINCDSTSGPVTVTTDGGQTIDLYDDGVAPDRFADDGEFTGLWTPESETTLLTFSSPAVSTNIRIPVLSITTDYLLNGNVRNTETPYRQFLEAAGGLPPYSWSIIEGGLPDGLSLDTSTGRITGFPVVTGTAEFRVKVFDAESLAAYADLSITIEDDIIYESRFTYGGGGENIALDGSGNIITSGFGTIYKHDPDLNPVWEVDFGGTVWRIASDAQGNVYATGFASGIYRTAKYDSSGNLLWAKMHGTMDSGGYGIAVDPAGYVYVTGINADRTGGILKYDPNGDLVWERSYISWTRPVGVALDGSGNVYVGGDRYNQFLAIKYDPDGAMLWIRTYALTTSDNAYGMTVDPDGNVYVAGTSGSASYDYFTVKFDTDGNVAGTFNYDSGINDFAKSVSIDEFGYVYVTGLRGNNFYGSVQTVCFDTIGNVVWVKNTELGEDSDIGLGIVADSSGIYVAALKATPEWTYVPAIIKYKTILAVTTSVLPAGEKGTDYNATLNATGGSRPYTWDIVSGSLPFGLSLDAASGVISGVPMAHGSYTFTVRATDMDGMEVTRELTVTAYEIITTLWQTGIENGYDDIAQDIAVDAAGNMYVTGYNSSGPTSYQQITAKFDASGSLVWMNTYTGDSFMNKGVGVAVDGSGNVYVANGTYDSIRTIKYGNDGSILWYREYNLNSFWSGSIAVNGAGEIFTVASSNSTTYLIKYSDTGVRRWVKTFDFPGQENIYDLSVDQNGNLYLTGDGSANALVARFDPAGTLLWQKAYDNANSIESGRGVAVDHFGNVYVAGMTAESIYSQDNILIVKYDADGNELWSRVLKDGHYAKGYDVAVDRSGNAYITAYTNHSGFLTVKYGPDGDLKLKKRYSWGLRFDANTLLFYSQGIAVDEEGGIYLALSGHNGVDYDLIAVKLHDDYVHMTLDDLSYALEGAPFSSSLGAVNGTPPCTWTVVSGSLPAGLSLDSQTGIISGTPAESGTYDFEVELRDAYGSSDKRAFRLPVDPALIIQQKTWWTVVVNEPAQWSHTATGGSGVYTGWSLAGGALPQGLSLNTETGEISGTPTVTGSYNYTLRVTDSHGNTQTQDFSFQVYQPLYIANETMANGALGTYYSDYIIASGGFPPYSSFGVILGTWPGGLEVDIQTGEIHGFPATPGTFTFYIKAYDSHYGYASKQVTLTIYPETRVITTSSLPDAVPGIPYSQTLSAEGGIAPYTWSIIEGNLPDGIALDPSTGTLAGTPAIAGTFDFTVSATDSVSVRVAKAFSLTVFQPDSDGDGYNSDVDCNDNNPSIFPGATEVPYNGIDENCNGMLDDDDVDQDGFNVEEDCNDNNPAIYPGAPEIGKDGIDQDCNGYDLTIEVTRADYDDDDRELTVYATSDYGADAALQVEGYGPMTWSTWRSRWRLREDHIWNAPETVTVSGPEGSIVVNVEIED